MNLNRLLLTTGLGLAVSCTTVNAQSGFFVGIDAASANVWTGTGIQIIDNLVSVLFEDVLYGDAIVPILGGRYTYEILKFKDDNTPVMFNPDDWYGLRTTFGFRPKDLFGHIIGNAKVGWMGPYSPIGAYFHIGYDYRYFSMILSYQTESQDYQIGTCNPGIGITSDALNLHHGFITC